MSIRIGHRRWLKCFLLAGLCLTSACAKDATKLTQIVVVIDSDLPVPDELDNLQIEVTGTKQQMPVIDAPVDTDEHKLPRSLGLVYSGGPLGPVRVIARGRLGDQTVVVRMAEVHFKKDRTLKLSLPLTRSCAGDQQQECPSDQTCDRGTCVAVALNLPTFNGDDGPFLVDAGPADPDGSAAISDASDDADGGGDASVQAPRCTIDSPTEDQRLYYQGDPITFVGSCTSPQGEPLDAHWNSTLAKKQLGNGRELTRDNLVVGSHEITLCANGTSACSDPLQIVVEPLPELSVAISSLAQQGSGEGVYRAEAALVASGTGSGVPPLEFTWIDSLAGEVCTGAKCTFEAPMVPGRHTLRLVAIDGRGRKIKAERSFIVHAPGRSALFEIYERANAVLTGTIKALASDGNFHYVGTDAGYVVQVPADMAETVYPITPTGSMAPRPEVKGLFVHASSNTLYFATSADVQSCDITNGTVKNCVTLTLGNLATAQPRCVRRLSYESTDYLVVGTSTGLWVGANSMLDQGNLRESGAEFNALTESAGKLWIAGSTGLSGYTLGSGGGFAGSPQKYAAAPSALSALAASEDLVWAVPSSGFARYDGDAASWTSWTMSYAEAEFGRLVHNEARSIAITHPLIDGGAHDVIWVGTSAGLSRFDPAIPSFTSYSKVDGLADNSVLQVVALPSNEVLVASPSGLSVYRGQ